MFVRGYAAAQNTARRARRAAEGRTALFYPRKMTPFWTKSSEQTFCIFWEQSIPDTGLVKDRCNTRAERDAGTVGSIAATGFGLTALCIGSERKYVPPAEARDRVIAALRFLSARMPTHRGFYYHWADVRMASACGIRKSPRSTPPSCCAAC